MDIFLIKLLFSFIVGGAYIAFTIWMSEKYGSKLGGILIGLPSTSLVSLFFIGWSQGLGAAMSAVQIMPAVIAVNTLFVVIFVILHRYGVHKSMAAAFFAWFAINVPLVIFGLEDIYFSILFAAILLAISALFLRKFPHRKLPAQHSTLREFTIRSAFVGCVVAFAVLISKTMGPLWGGMFASFPAAYSSSMLLIERKHGIDFAASVGRSMPYGTLCTVIFMLAFFLSAPSIGLIFGLALAFAFSLAAGALFYKMKI